MLLLLLCLPLGWTLSKQLDEGRAMPIGYPVTRAVSRALHDRVSQDAGVRILLLARGSVVEGVAVYLATDHDLTKAYRDELRSIVREEMDDPDLMVRVIAVQSAMDE